jgi:hypothetical protein
VLYAPQHTPRITNHKSQITNHKSQITNHKSQITNHKSQITNHTSQITNYTTHHTPHTPYTIHHTPRTTHHAPRTTHHAPRTTHHAPRTTHHAPRTTHHTQHSCTIIFCDFYSYTERKGWEKIVTLASSAAPIPLPPVICVTQYVFILVFFILGFHLVFILVFYFSIFYFGISLFWRRYRIFREIAHLEIDLGSHFALNLATLLCNLFMLYSYSYFYFYFSPDHIKTLPQNLPFFWLSLADPTVEQQKKFDSYLAYLAHGKGDSPQKCLHIKHEANLLYPTRFKNKRLKTKTKNEKRKTKNEKRKTKNEKRKTKNEKRKTKNEKRKT